MDLPSFRDKREAVVFYYRNTNLPASAIADLVKLNRNTVRTYIKAAGASTTPSGRGGWCRGPVSLT